MANKVIATPFFERKFKKLVKKFPSLFDELCELEIELTENPKTGIDLGSNLFKIRVASKSKNTGKSGGFRVVTYLVDKTKMDMKLILLPFTINQKKLQLLKMRY